MPTNLSHLTELVVVCGHATFTGTRKDVMSEDHWILQPFQRSNPSTGKPGEHHSFINHILAAAFLVASRPGALLIFSGGRTTSSERTEAQSYEHVHLGLGDPFEIGDRYAREDYATDSFQNLLFSILRFKQVVGRYPQTITVVTHAFKRERILGAHAAALRWPAECIRLHGVDPPFTNNEWHSTAASEERAAAAFAQDQFGFLPPLADKRRSRYFDPDAVEKAYADLEPDAVQLLRYCNRGEGALPSRFPWEFDSSSGRLQGGDSDGRAL